MLAPGVIVRLTALGVVAVIVQITAVSQITLLGTSADLTPLVVVSVGLLCGSVAGAGMGFGMGLLVDVALLQTLGISSLLFTVIGYAAGRLREARDPAHGLIPLAVGAAGTALAAVGYGMIQFLLGVEAPVSLLLLREILATVAVNTLLALPVYALVRRLVGPALPQDPRRRRGRQPSMTRLSPFTRA
ncbi:MAG TPA: rod shape-determining protein MreD [Solirubrobacteraceae bacterium]|nr:rod shape-determining protein MreD [Solirubrobacteraceae bacterium]